MSHSTRPAAGMLGATFLVALLATGLFSGAATAAAPAAAAEADDANMRRDARRDWYGGDRTPEYRRFLFGAALAEQARRASLKTRSSTASSAAGTPVTWRSLGPTGANFEQNGVQIKGVDSGRLNGIVVSPVDGKTIYVATSGGGVWKTANGGQSWLPLTDSLPDLFIGAIEMDPVDPNVLYIGLGDFADSAGLGVGAFLKSADGGQTWSSPVSLSQQSGAVVSTATYIKQLLASPYVPGLILAATDIGLFRSVDYGGHWTPVVLPGAAGSAPEVWSIAWTGGGGFVASVINAASYYGPGLVYFSQDSGVSWTPASGLSLSVNSVGRVTLAAAPSNRSIVYALAGDSVTYGLGDIFRSADGGATWAPLKVSAQPINPNPDIADIASLFGNQAWYDELLLVSPADPNVFFFGGSFGMAESADGGATYSQISNWLGQDGLPYVHADLQCGVFDSAGNLYIGTDGGLSLSRDQGITWTTGLNNGIVSHLAYSVSSSLANRDAVIGGVQDDGTRLRAGVSSTFNMVLGGDGFGSHMHALDPNRMIASQYYETVSRSEDGGFYWQVTSGSIPNGDVFYTRIVPGLSDPSGNTIYTLTSQRVYKSTDYALTWSPLGTTGLPATALRNVAAAASDPQVLGVIAASNHAALTSDGGATWHEVGPLPNTQGYLGSISFDPSNAQIVYVTSVGPVATDSHLWKSVDGGASWTALDGTGSGLPAGIPINAVVIDPTNTQRLYAGTYFGLYQSINGGAAWTVAGSGLPMVDVTDIYVAPDASFLRVSTFGRGFWELGTASLASAITISPGVLPGGQLGTPYADLTLSASGGTAPYTYAVTANGLPPGFALSPSGTLSGTSNVAEFWVFRVTATDSTPVASGGPLTGSQAYLLNIAAPAPLVMTPSSVPYGVFNAPYPGQSFMASGGTAPYVFTVTAGALPGGLALSPAGALGGTPTATGASSFRVTATDSTPVASGGPLTATQVYDMTVVTAPQLVMTPASVPGGTVNVSYASQTLSVTGGMAPYSFAVTGGSLPAGLTLDSAGSLSGVPTAAGQYPFVITATDSTPVAVGGPFAVSASYSVNIAAAYPADSYDGTRLTIPSVVIGNATYSNVVVTVGKIVSGPTGTVPVGTSDTYDPASQQLTIPEVQFGSRTYYNVVVAVTGLVSIGSASGVDVFDGQYLHVPYVQYLSQTYPNIVLAVGLANVVGVAGGMPAAPFDQYDGVTGQVLVPAVQFGNRIYTNVTLKAGPANIVR